MDNKYVFRPERKAFLGRFSFRHNAAAAVLLALFFIHGLYISQQAGVYRIVIYLILWLVSYIILFKCACSRCPYYGVDCPVPLEGSCVHLFFGKQTQPFGWGALAWASFAYVLRIILPVITLYQKEMLLNSLIYLGLMGAFWIIHLRVTGCPNCINVQCPLNPDFRSQDSSSADR